MTYLGVDIGGTKTLVATLDDSGAILEQKKFFTPKEYSKFLSQLADTIGDLKNNKFTAAAVAAPGRIDRSKGIAIAFGNLPWEKVAIKSDMEKLVDCPVLIENDANLAGLSEAMLLKNEYKKVLYLTVSTGIRDGYIVNGIIDPSLQDNEPGQAMLEHEGKMQKWEDFASGRAIVKRFGKRASDITDEETWRVISRYLAQGLLELIAIVQPEVIVIGGGVGTYFKRFEKLLLEELHRYENPLIPIPPILGAARPEEAVIYGCYDLARSVYGKTN